MSEFHREDRYIVIKRTDMDKASGVSLRVFKGACRSLHDSMLINGAPARSFLVIEGDWPEYEPVWQMIEARMNGEPNALDAALAREAALREELERFKRDAEQDTTIDERDRYHEMADSLALAISQHFRVEIGEHSSMNCPWSVELEVLNGAYVTDTDEGRERAAIQQRLTDAEQKLGEAYDWGYTDGQNCPNGYSDKADRDKCVAELLKPAEGKWT